MSRLGFLEKVQLPLIISMHTSTTLSFSICTTRLTTIKQAPMPAISRFIIIVMRVVTAYGSQSDFYKACLGFPTHSTAWLLRGLPIAFGASRSQLSLGNDLGLNSCWLLFPSASNSVRYRSLSGCANGVFAIICVYSFRLPYGHRLSGCGSAYSLRCRNLVSPIRRKSVRRAPESNRHIRRCWATTLYPALSGRRGKGSRYPSYPSGLTNFLLVELGGIEPPSSTPFSFTSQGLIRPRTTIFRDAILWRMLGFCARCLYSRMM